MSLDVYLMEPVYERNITHNLGTMAKEAGIYEALWRPEERDWTIAGDLIAPLSEGLELLRSDPERFKTLNPTNGWGDYDLLVSFAETYLAACMTHQFAEVRVSR